jgi:TPR repeat protein
MVREGRVPEIHTGARELAARGCTRDDPMACETLGELMEQAGEPAAEMIDAYDRACEAGAAAACLRAGIVYANGDVVSRDEARALFYFTIGCQLGDAQSCEKGRAGLR